MQLVLEAVRGKSWDGDIAVDDVTVATGPCSELDPSGQWIGSVNRLCYFTRVKENMYIIPAIIH